MLFFCSVFLPSKQPGKESLFLRWRSWEGSRLELLGLLSLQISLLEEILLAVQRLFPFLDAINIAAVRLLNPGLLVVPEHNVQDFLQLLFQR